MKVEVRSRPNVTRPKHLLHLPALLCGDQQYSYTYAIVIVISQLPHTRSLKSKPVAAAADIKRPITNHFCISQGLDHYLFRDFVPIGQIYYPPLDSLIPSLLIQLGDNRCSAFFFYPCIYPNVPLAFKILLRLQHFLSFEIYDSIPPDLFRIRYSPSHRVLHNVFCSSSNLHACSQF